MSNSKYAQENEIHKILKYFEIQTDHPIPVRRLDIALQRTCHLVDFNVPANQRVKIKDSEKIDRYLDLAREMKKLY